MARTNATIARVAAWVRDTLAAHALAEVHGEMSRPRIVAFTLSHQAAGVVRTETGAQITVGSSGVDPAYVASYFYERAIDYASGLTGGSGMQQFVIEAHAEGVSEPVAHFPLKANSVADLEGAVMSTEPADSKGLLTQMMRHTEYAMSALARMNEQLMATNAQLVHESQTTIRKGYENLELTEALITKAAEGEHQKRIEMMQLENTNRMKEKLLTLAPAAANAVVGREIFPTAVADTGIIEMIAEDLSVDDLQGLMMVLQAKSKNKEALGLLFHRITEIITKKEREKTNGEFSAPTQ